MNNFEIIDDLIDRKILIGKGSAGVKRVLGNPDLKVMIGIFGNMMKGQAQDLDLQIICLL